MKSSGTLRTNEDLSIKGRFDNDGTVETSKNVAVSGDINNTGKILASGNLSGRNTVSAGVISSRNVNVDDLKNDGTLETAEDVKVSGNIRNTGRIASMVT